MPKPMLRQMSKDGRSIRSSTQRRMNSCHGRQYCPAIQVRTRNSSDHCSNRLSWNAGRSRWYTMPTFTVGMPRHSIPRLMVVVPRLLLSRRTMVQPLLVGTIPRGGADLAERGRPWRHFCFTKETAAAAAAVVATIRRATDAYIRNCARLVAAAWLVPTTIRGGEFTLVQTHWSYRSNLVQGKGWRRVSSARTLNVARMIYRAY
mmetsp:Transcript_21421/g.46706  ORF Transcript_21421/g.46706 Transcript_21421/m.46706 type:complete len:204 (-) Transcript_21421:188-799(-)